METTRKLVVNSILNAVFITGYARQVIVIEPQRFNPTQITLKDDAAHTPKIFGNVETWYYDAIFHNEYSIVCVVNNFQFLKMGLILTGLFIYKGTKLIKWIRTRTPTKQLYISHERPHIILRGKTIIDAEMTSDPKEWTYHISLGDEKNSVDLQFVKKMGAWKGNHFLGDWLVVPTLEVNGNIKIDGTETGVTGHGYHDHNNYPLFAPFFSKGANFGKITAGPINVVWAQVVRTINNIQNILVINTADTVQSLQSNDIKLLVKESITDRRKLVPTKYVLQVEKQDIFINIEIQSLNYHYLTIPAVKYWRHHAKNSGEIRVGSRSEKVDDISIIDQLTFL